MIDIVGVSAGVSGDVQLQSTQAPRAANILSVQLGSLEYAEDLGIDLKYFLSEDFEFEDAAFKSYLIQRLANSSVNVTSVKEVVQTFYSQYKFEVANEENSTALIAR